mmetsp:Transcript_45199/g.101084  ORF Transcript_45199/g.101084 Transcript_45199/m.101084 type:complete len:221 (-) Transcript_45199:112-774(-)
MFGRTASLSLARPANSPMSCLTCWISSSRLAATGRRSSRNDKSFIASASEVRVGILGVLQFGRRVTLSAWAQFRKSLATSAWHLMGSSLTFTSAHPRVKSTPFGSRTLPSLTEATTRPVPLNLIPSASFLWVLGSSPQASMVIVFQLTLTVNPRRVFLTSKWVPWDSVTALRLVNPSFANSLPELTRRFAVAIGRHSFDCWRPSPSRGCAVFEAKTSMDG